MRSLLCIATYISIYIHSFLPSFLHFVLPSRAKDEPPPQKQKKIPQTQQTNSYKQWPSLGVKVSEHRVWLDDLNLQFLKGFVGVFHPELSWGECATAVVHAQRVVLRAYSSLIEAGAFKGGFQGLGFGVVASSLTGFWLLWGGEPRGYYYYGFRSLKAMIGRACCRSIVVVYVDPWGSRRFIGLGLYMAFES